VAGGYLGLGFDLPDNGPSFITTLKDQGLIEKRQVAVGIIDKSAIVSIGDVNDTLLYPNPAEAKFQTYQSVDKSWEIEVRGFSFLGKTTETEYLSYAVIDSFSRGIQIPNDEYFKFAVEMKKLFNGPNEEFYCEPFQCYFLDRSC